MRIVNRLNRVNRRFCMQKTMNALQALYLISFLSQMGSFTNGATVDTLLDQLRSKQIEAMLNEQKKALSLKLPEKLAEASFEEAKKKSLEAESESFVINATPYSPFAADKGPKNLGYLGRGYDVLYGDPLDEAGRVDPGFRLPVISLNYLKNVFSPDGEYRMPDNADIIKEPSALFSSSYNDVRTVSDYKQTLTEDVKTTAGFELDAGFVSVAGEFSQSRSYQNAKQSMKKGGTVNIDIIGRATVYKARLHTLADSLKVSPVLQNAIEKLPKTCVGENASSYYRLIQNFGTHYTSVVTMGAKAVQRLSMGTAESLELKKLGISTSEVVSLSVGLRAKGVSARATYGKETSSSSETTKSEQLAKMDIQKKEFYIGGEPPSEASSLDEQGSTASLRQWGRSAFERPVPIQYELRNINELFQQSYLTKTVDDLTDKKTCIEEILGKYCSKVAVDKQDCVAYEDGSNKKDAIRYGDFIAVKRASSQNNNEYLTVPEKFPQFTTKANTEQLMKVVPVDRGAAWKYGKALHYGEPFNLVSEYGGENGVAYCGVGAKKRLKLFNYGKTRITCSKEDNPVGQWEMKLDHWCGKTYEHVMVSGKFSPRECQAKCLELTNGECKAIQWLDSYYERCYYCDDVGKIEKYDNIYFPFRVYKRESTTKLEERPVRIAALYLTSPAGKNEGQVVLNNEKVYIGVDSYEERKPLFDVHRPAFVKVETSNAVNVVEDDLKTKTAQTVSACSTGIDTSKVKSFLDCDFWWQIKSSPKALRTYPNTYYEDLTQGS